MNGHLTLEERQKLRDMGFTPAQIREYESKQGGGLTPNEERQLLDMGYTPDQIKEATGEGQSLLQKVGSFVAKFNPFDPRTGAAIGLGLAEVPTAALRSYAAIPPGTPGGPPVGTGTQMQEGARVAEQALHEAVPEGYGGPEMLGRMSGEMALMGTGFRSLKALGAGTKTAAALGSAPVAGGLAYGGVESSSAEGLGQLFDSETLKNIAKDPVQRVAFEVMFDVTLGVGGELIGGLRRAKGVEAPRVDVPERAPELDIRRGGEEIVQPEVPRAPEARVEPLEIRRGGEEAIEDIPVPQRPPDLADRAEQIARGQLDARDIDVEDYIGRLEKYTVDPDGQLALAAETDRVIRELGIEKTTEPLSVVRAEARTIARDIGLDPNKIDAQGAQRLTRAGLHATRNVIRDNVDAIVVLTKKLDDTSLSIKDHERIVQALGGIEQANDKLVSKFISERTQRGRDLNALKLVAERVNDPSFWLIRARKFAERQLTAEEMARLTEIANRLRITRGAEQDQALKEMRNFVGRLRKSPGWEKSVGFFKANLLTLPSTHAVNVLSNTTNLYFERMARLPGSGWDWLISKTLRAARNGENIRTLRAPSRMGVREVREAGLKAPEHTILNKLDISRRVNYDNPIMDAYVNTIFDWLQKEDLLAHAATFRYSLAQEIKGWAKAAKIDPMAAINDVVDGLKTGNLQGAAQTAPVDDFLRHAIEDANQATFRDQTRLAQAARGIIRPLPGVEFVAPFTRTPAAVATRIFESTPAGAASGVYNWQKVWRAATKGRKTVKVAGRDLPIADAQREIAKVMGRATTGSGLMFLGAVLAANDLATGTGERYGAPEQRAEQLGGRSPNSLKIAGEFRDLARWTPAGMLIALGATLYEDYKGKGPFEAAALQPVRTVRTVLDQPFVTGPRQLLETVESGKVTGPAVLEGLGDVATNVARGFIPGASLMGGLARGTSGPVRDARQGGAIPEMGKRLASGIPIAAAQLPPKRDVLGDVVERPGGVIRQTIEQVFSPLRATTSREGEPIVDELVKVKWAPPPLRREENESAQEFDQRQVQYGNYAKQAIQAVMNSREYQQLEGLEQNAERFAQANNMTKRDFLEAVRQERQRQISGAVSRVRSFLTRNQ